MTVKRMDNVMQSTTIKLFDVLHFEGLKDSEATLTSYIASKNIEMPRSDRPSILILPGGGYEYCSQREGEPIALYFLSKGMNAFVLEYSTRKTTKHRFPMQLLEAMAALIYIKKTAKEHDGNDKKVHVIGFSAGGHLAASLGFLGQKDIFKAKLGVDKHTDLSIASLILGYPVISMNVETHRSSFENIHTEQFGMDYLSLESHVTKDAPPLFIFSTSDDAAVPIKNSLCLLEKYADFKIPFETHIYEKGFHGFSLANELVSPKEVIDHIQKNIPTWVEDASYFISRH